MNSHPIRGLSMPTSAWGAPARRLGGLHGPVAGWQDAGMTLKAAFMHNP
jgi:hypothetical protein